mmetsp:Transcript_8035/g.11611  ORF Transcript_8035/g.11611 Transcript_8035/m.11611 type:complete len:82 (-) Transcript_8035:226-471(-)
MKEAFGREAWSKINYVECSRQAPTGTPDICQEAGVKGYPTFQLGNNSNKQVFSGELELSELASISKYAGKIVDPVMDDGGD